MPKPTSDSALRGQVPDRPRGRSEVDPAVLAELSEFLRIPSVSSDPDRARDVRRAAEWVCTYVRRAGGSAEVVDWHGQPLAIAEIPASGTAETAPTVLVYGHFDVQAPEPLGAWDSPPFEPTVRDGWLYGRGTADDKGQLFLLLRAAAELAGEGTLPVNVRVCCDGEEETGGDSIVDYLQVDSRPIDAAVIFDTEMPERGTPAFVVATRGLLFFQLRVTTGRRDLHSGVFGGAALNALHALIEVLAPLMPVGGRLPDPLRVGAAAAPESEVASWTALPSGADALAAAGARPVAADAEEAFYLRTWTEPSLDVHGVTAGSTAHKTIVPAVAEAAFSIRLVAGQRVEAVAAEVERLVRAAVPVGAEVELELSGGTPAATVDADSPAISLALAAFERALGVRPLLVRSGGSIPIVSALEERGIPTVVTGFDLPEGNIHAPNERLLVEHIPLGVAAARELLLAYGDLTPTGAQAAAE